MPQVFVSYAWDDFQCPDWINEFFELLQKDLWSLGSPNKLRVNLWRDVTNIRSSQGLIEAIFPAVDNSQVLVALLSGFYWESTWCPEEFKQFCQRIDLEVNIGGGRSQRLLLAPIGPHPPENLRYEFLEGNNLEERFYFHPVPGLPRVEKFEGVEKRELIKKIASSIIDVLMAEPALPPSRWVYLAPPPPSLRGYRSDLDKFLQELDLGKLLTLHNKKIVPELCVHLLSGESRESEARFYLELAKARKLPMLLYFEGEDPIPQWIKNYGDPVRERSQVEQAIRALTGSHHPAPTLPPGKDRAVTLHWKPCGEAAANRFKAYLSKTKVAPFDQASPLSQADVVVLSESWPREQAKHILQRSPLASVFYPKDFLRVREEWKKELNPLLGESVLYELPVEGPPNGLDKFLEVLRTR